MKLYIEWSDLWEILQIQNSLKMWWYKWELIVVLTAKLKKDIDKKLLKLLKQLWPT